MPKKSTTNTLRRAYDNLNEAQKLQLCKNFCTEFEYTKKSFYRKLNNEKIVWKLEKNFFEKELNQKIFNMKARQFNFFKKIKLADATITLGFRMWLYVNKKFADTTKTTFFEASQAITEFLKSQL
jgi:hypothetical protein